MTGTANTSRIATPAMIAVHGRAVMKVAQRSKPGDGRTCSGFFGFSQRLSAPIMIGRIVSADTTTPATPIAAPTPSLPISGIPITSRPAIATMTIRPAVTTVAPDVASALADASRTLSPDSTCSR